MGGKGAKGDPREYVDLDGHREAIRRIHCPILWAVIQAARQNHLDEVAREVAADLFDRIADETLWAVTEVRPSDEYKLLSQRYISDGVRTKWLALATSGETRAAPYCRGPDGKVAVRHEHVVPREQLKKELLEANAIDAVMHVLEKPIACIVTLEEDALLPKAGDGWMRYQNRVLVFDRKEQKRVGDK